MKSYSNRMVCVNKVYLFLVAFVLITIYLTHYNTKETQEIVTKVAAGQLEAEYQGLHGKQFNVAMLNGSFEMSRANDIERLVKERRGASMRMKQLSAAGDKTGMSAATSDFEEINARLGQYDTRDVAFIAHWFNAQ